MSKPAQSGEGFRVVEDRPPGSPRAEPRFGFQITWISRLLRTRFDARARTVGLTRAQWRTIASIAYSEGCTQSELASRLEVNSVTAGRILDRLETSGLVERRIDPEDRRANRLYLKPTAAPVLKRLSELGLAEDSVAVDGLTEAEKVTLARLLDRVIANLAGAPRPEPSAEGEDIDPDEE